MDEIKEYRILYSDAATQDILEKVDYTLYQLQDPINTDRWYLSLKSAVQEGLSTWGLSGADSEGLAGLRENGIGG